MNCDNDDVLPVSQPAMSTRLKSSARDEDAGSRDDISSWEPLTLAALMDYKTQLTAPGHGQFALGHVRLWPAR